MTRILALGLLAILSASPASAFMARNNTLVEGNAAQFEVHGRPSLSASQAWCGAGDYALHMLHLSRSARIWRLSEPPRRSGEGVKFSTSSEGAASRTGLATSAKGASLSISAATQLCPLANSDN